MIIYVYALQLQLQSFKPINTLPDLHMGTSAAMSAQYMENLYWFTFQICYWDSIYNLIYIFTTCVCVCVCPTRQFSVLIHRRNRPGQSVGFGKWDSARTVGRKTGFSPRFGKRDHFCLCSTVTTPKLQAHQHTPGLAHGHRCSNVNSI
jgi:hypothetical protein